MKVCQRLAVRAFSLWGQVGAVVQSVKASRVSVRVRDDDVVVVVVVFFVVVAVVVVFLSGAGAISGILLQRTNALAVFVWLFAGPV